MCECVCWCWYYQVSVRLHGPGRGAQHKKHQVQPLPEAQDGRHQASAALEVCSCFVSAFSPLFSFVFYFCSCSVFPALVFFCCFLCSLFCSFAVIVFCSYERLRRVSNFWRRLTAPSEVGNPFRNRCNHTRPTAIFLENENNHHPLLVRKWEMLPSIHQRTQVDHSCEYPAAKVASDGCVTFISSPEYEPEPLSFSYTKPRDYARFGLRSLLGCWRRIWLGWASCSLFPI